jgi:hypothetical protein
MDSTCWKDWQIAIWKDMQIAAEKTGRVLPKRLADCQLDELTDWSWKDCRDQLE